MENRISDPGQWLETYGDVLFRFALSRVHNAALAEDLVQETLVAAWQGKDRFSGRSTERTWLIGILKHEIVDQIRKLSREQSVADSETLDALHDRHFLADGHWNLRPTQWERHPSRSFEDEEFWLVLEKCLSRLKPRERMAFTLRELEEAPPDELCQALNVSRSNLWVILHRARIKLRACLERNWFGASETVCGSPNASVSVPDHETEAFPGGEPHPA